MNDRKRYLTLSELALVTGGDPKQLDEIAERNGAKSYHQGFGCYIYDRKKISLPSPVWRPTKPAQPVDITGGKRYLTLNELAQFLETDPGTAKRIGDASGALIKNESWGFDVYDREIISKHTQGSKVYTVLTESDIRKINENRRNPK